MNSIQHVLSDDELYTRAKAIFAPAPHGSRSDRFGYVPTIKVIDGLRKNGFNPVWAGACKTRDKGKIGFEKHMVRFAADESRMLAGSVPQLVMVNAHDGSASYSLHAGMFTLVCTNGCIFSEGQAQVVRVRHSGDVVNNVIEGSFKVIEDADSALEEAAEWRGITMTESDRYGFGKMALYNRFGVNEETGEPDTNVTPDQIIMARRPGGDDPTLWNAFQNAQEWSIRGGLRSFNEKTRRVSHTREIQGIDAVVEVNTKLSETATLFARTFGIKRPD